MDNSEISKTIYEYVDIFCKETEIFEESLKNDMDQYGGISSIIGELNNNKKKALLIKNRAERDSKEKNIANILKLYGIMEKRIADGRLLVLSGHATASLRNYHSALAWCRSDLQVVMNEINGVEHNNKTSRTWNKQDKGINSETVYVIKSRAKDLSILSQSLLSLVDNEIRNMRSSMPNDENNQRLTVREIESLENYKMLIYNVNSCINKLLASDGAIIDRDETDLAVKELKLFIHDWIERNAKDITDSGARLALMGIGTAFLAFCGAPLAGAFTVSVALVGGSKVAGVIGNMSKKEKP